MTDVPASGGTFGTSARSLWSALARPLPGSPPAARATAIANGPAAVRPRNAADHAFASGPMGSCASGSEGDRLRMAPPGRSGEKDEGGEGGGNGGGATQARVWPIVTIAMPCLNEAGFIEACIRSIQHQDYPADRFELLIVDGGSTDGTRAAVERLVRDDARIRLLENPERIQAAAMNVALAAAKGEIIVRMDVHCEYAQDYVTKCVETLEKTGADNVGGAQRARATTRFQRALCCALGSPLGVGGVKYRSADQEGFVDTVFLGAFRRKIFEQVGSYDAGAITNEDAELNQRILDAGGKIYLSRDIVVYYHPRESFRDLAKQYYKYGRGRARTLLKHGRFPSIRPILPFFMTCGGALLLATAHVQPFTPFAFAAYALATGAEAVRVGRREGLSAVPIVWAIFPVLHVSHGVGFAAGLVRYLLRPDFPAVVEMPQATHAARGETNGVHAAGVVSGATE